LQAKQIVLIEIQLIHRVRTSDRPALVWAVLHLQLAETESELDATVRIEIQYDLMCRTRTSDPPLLTGLRLPGLFCISNSLKLNLRVEQNVLIEMQYNLI
jgi:hypothetical protein